MGLLDSVHGDADEVDVADVMGDAEVDWQAMFLASNDQQSSVVDVHAADLSSGDDDDDGELTGLRRRSREDSMTTPMIVEHEPNLGAGDWNMQEIDDVFNVLGFGRFQVKVLVLCGMANFCMSFETALTMVLLRVLKDEWGLSNGELAFLGAVPFLGAAFGAAMNGLLADHFGRKPVLRINMLLAGLFGVTSAFTESSFPFFCLWRGLLGFGYGGVVVVSAVYVAEFLPSKRRGRYLILMDVFFGLGAVACVALSRLVIPAYGWRYMVALAAVPSLLFLLFLGSFRESVRWLVMRHEMEMASSVLTDIAFDNRAEPVLVRKIQNHRLEQTEIEPEGTFVDTSYKKLFDPLLKPTAATLVIMWFMTSLAGTLFIYLPRYLVDKSMVPRGHFLVEDAYQAALVIGLGDVLGSLAIAIIIPNYDRRTVLRASIGLMAILCSAIGFLESRATFLLSMLPFASAVRSAVTAQLYLYTPEILPTAVRCTGLGLASCLHRLAPALTYFTVSFLMDASFMHSLTAFGTMYALSFCVSFMLPYDTCGKALAYHYYEEVKWIKSERKSSLALNHSKSLSRANSRV